MCKYVRFSTKFISDDVQIIGKRPGEKTDEDLISREEITRTYIHGNDIHIKMKENQGDNKLTEPYNSKRRPKMTTSEMGI